LGVDGVCVAEGSRGVAPPESGEGAIETVGGLRRVRRHGVGVVLHGLGVLLAAKGVVAGEAEAVRQVRLVARVEVVKGRRRGW
jgi:hypothetical protein